MFNLGAWLLLVPIVLGYFHVWYFHFYRNDKVATFRKRIIAQSRTIDGDFYPDCFLPSYFTMIYKFWRPLKSYLPKGYNMESIDNILREAEGKDDIKARIEKGNRDLKNLL